MRFKLTSCLWIFIICLVLGVNGSRATASFEEDLEPIKILSIDGGGVRGIIPALMLEELEKQTGKSVANMFDMVAGTSIGGILSLYMTEPDHTGKSPKYTAREAVDLFETKSKLIFSRPWYRPLTTLGGILGPKYDHLSLENLLKETFEPKGLFSNRLKDTIVSSYELERDRPYFFKSYEKQTNQFYTHQVARATSAAPTYFAPTQILDLDNEIYSFVDGGVVANNPAMEAYLEAKKKYGDSRKIILVSLGTGDSIEAVTYKEANKWGLLGWVQPVLRMTMEGVSTLVHEQLSILTKTEENHYLRLQTILTKQENVLDNYSPENLRLLRHRTEKTIEQKYDQIEKIAHKILGKEETF